MKKLLFLLSITVIFVLLLSSCTLDFSHEIDSGMDKINEAIDDGFYPLLKEDEKYSSDTDSEEPSENEKPSFNPDEYEIGTEIGQILPSYSVSIFDENGVSNEKIDPTKLGKVTVINFWGTWCPPCVGELPEFDDVASARAEQITIVAIHSVDKFDTLAVAHVENNFKDSKIIFAKDENLELDNIYFDECYETFGGNGYYPYTIILNENGVITYKATGAISAQTLDAEIEKALNN